MNESDHAAPTPLRHPAARAAGLALGVVAGLALFARLAANRVERRVPADGPPGETAEQRKARLSNELLLAFCDKHKVPRERCHPPR